MIKNHHHADTCESCIQLGDIDGVDLYFCSKHAPNKEGPFIVIFDGTELPKVAATADEHTDRQFKSKPFMEALRLAKEQGLID